MPRIKIKELPKDQKISKAEMKAILGGTDYLNQAILPQGEDLIKPGIVKYMGMGQIDLGRLEDARACYERAVAMEPYDARLPFNLAVVLQQLGRVEEAIAAYNRSIELNPAFTEAYLHLARTLEEQGEIERAISIYQIALELCPKSTLLNNASLRMFALHGLWKTAESLIEKVMNARYHDSEIKLLDKLLFILNSTFLSWQEILSKHIEWGNLQIARCRKENLKCEFSDRPSHECLRIGYLSPDFRRHPVGFLFKEIIAHHDNHSFKVYCYSLSDDHDQVTVEIERCSFVYRQVSHLPAKSVARQIIEDGIDILVDLAGHTRGNRLEVLGYKPAPIQVTALGYPNGTGLPAVDYRVTDSFTDIYSADEQYVEKLVRLPRCFMPFVDLPISPQSYTKEDLGIPSDAVIFVSFNALYKLNPHVLKLWNRILEAVPDAYLLFSFMHSHFDLLKNNILSHFKSGEDHTDRIRILPWARAELHRNRYELADIALDTFPYSGAMTSYEALYRGVPVVTLVGDRHVQRTTYSLLRNIDLDDGIATSEQEYFQKAISLSGNTKALCRIKNRIRNAVKHPHLRARWYTKHLELAYRMMWERYDSRSKPDAILVPSLNHSPMLHSEDSA